MSEAQRYRVLERLASGGMAEVFLAESAGIEGFKKQVAIKRVLPHLSEKKRFIAMFLDEARLSAHLSHSNVVQVFDIGVGDSAYFIVMEYVDGADLKAIIDWQKKIGKTLPVEAACFVASKICEGLSYAHELSGPGGEPLEIVHRDMSPPNVLMTKYGEVKIVDFGLAKATSQLEKSEAGVIKGKFSYLSPEAASGNPVDARTDIFAVGIILWEMLTCRRLFLGDTDMATVRLVQRAEIPAIRTINPDVPPELEAILTRALARHPADRYRTARELGRDLTSFLFRYGHPIGAFDLATFVREAMALRATSRPDQGSIIDRLIEEALLEFTSLQNEKGAAPPAKMNEPLKLGGFEDIGKWADEIAFRGQSVPPPSSSSSFSPTSRSSVSRNPSAPPSAPSSSSVSAYRSVPPSSMPPSSGSGVSSPRTRIPSSIPPPDLEEGNLAALEDYAEEDFAAEEHPAAIPSLRPRAVLLSEMPLGHPAGVPRGNGALVAGILVAVLCVVCAAAWFGGLIPH